MNPSARYRARPLKPPAGLVTSALNRCKMFGLNKPRLRTGVGESFHGLAKQNFTHRFERRQLYR